MSLFSFGAGSWTVTRAIPFGEKLWPGVIVFGLITGVAFWFGGSMAWENHLFADHAQRMESRVLRKYIAESHGKNGPIYTPHTVYRYQVGNLVTQCDDSVDRGTWDAVHEGGGMPIKYLPEKPSDNRIDNGAVDYKDELIAKFGLIAGLIGLILGVANAVATNRRIKLVERLLTTGLSTTGRVTAVDTERVGKSQQTFLRFEFTDNVGRVVSGRTGGLSWRQQRLWSQDKAITVFFDPVNSSVFTVNPNVVGGSQEVK